MGISIDITTESWDLDNLDWLATRFGLDTCRPCTLDISLFTAEGLGITDAKGFIPSGILIAKVTATNLYGPYDPDGTDGRETAAGHLIHGCRVQRSDGVALTTAAEAFLWQGNVLSDKLPSFSGDEGELDAAAQADLPHIRYETVAE